MELRPGFSNDNYYISWSDRNGFAPWVMALAWVITAFILFQLGGLILLLGSLVASGEINTFLENPANIEPYLTHLITGNSIMQILVFAFGTILFARLSTQSAEIKSFLRLQTDNRTLVYSFLAVLLIVSMQPVIYLLSYLNAQIPLPDFIQGFEDSQNELISGLLTGDQLLLVTLIHIAVVPSVCEEIMYRGYVMRMFERSTSPMWAILITGFIFGAYHMRISQLIPLILLGVVITWLAWKSNSLVPAMAAHLANNGGSVFLANRYPEMAEVDFSETFTLDPLLIGGSVIFSAILVYVISEKVKNRDGGAP
ncbi:MAG: CPBP family intramembrane metalloprotease [Rhodothermaceae bacterium]|nr:CPBP family intramembrane metalloprotease [Rhodothermaceae bacterium]